MRIESGTGTGCKMALYKTDAPLGVETHLYSWIGADCGMVLVLELDTVVETDTGEEILVEEGSEHTVHRSHLRQNSVDSRCRLHTLLPSGGCAG